MVQSFLKWPFICSQYTVTELFTSSLPVDIKEVSFLGMFIFLLETFWDYTLFIICSYWNAFLVIYLFYSWCVLLYLLCCLPVKRFEKTTFKGTIWYYSFPWQHTAYFVISSDCFISSRLHISYINSTEYMQLKSFLKQVLFTFYKINIVKP